MPSPALTSILKLRHLVPVLEAGGADELWLAACILEYLDGAERGLTLDQALDLAPVPGAVSWWTAEQVEARDAAIRALAARYYPSLRPGTKARKIERLALRYATASWRHDRDHDVMPERYAGTEIEHLWRASKSGAAWPLKRRQLETILAPE